MEKWLVFQILRLLDIQPPLNIIGYQQVVYKICCPAGSVLCFISLFLFN